KQLANSDSQYKENLVRIFADAGRYEEALTLIEELNAELGRSEIRERQQQWMEMRISAGTAKTEDEIAKSEGAERRQNEGGNSLEESYRKIEGFKKNLNFEEVLSLAE